MLARREHSRAELGAKLRARGHEAARVEAVLDALAAENLQSDARFAEQFARQRGERGQGPVRIRYELAERGVDASLIDQHAEWRAEHWHESAARERRKRFGSAPPHDLKARARQTRFLERRGFTADQIRWALKRAPE